MEAYRTPAGGQTFRGEITEKKSRFIGEIRHISSQEEAKEMLAGIRKENYDARHHCSAWILKGEEGAPDVKHSSDDGEPSGTAGRPILDVLEGAGLKDVMLVVTRYFGGTLLGTGGLARAYSAAARAALDAADIVSMEPGREAVLDFAYPGEGAVRRFLDEKGFVIADSEYTDRVRFRLHIPEREAAAFQKDLLDLMQGRVEVSLSEEISFL